MCLAQTLFDPTGRNPSHHSGGFFLRLRGFQALRIKRMGLIDSDEFSESIKLFASHVLPEMVKHVQCCFQECLRFSSDNKRPAEL